MHAEKVRSLSRGQKKRLEKKINKFASKQALVAAGKKMRKEVSEQ